MSDAAPLDVPSGDVVIRHPSTGDERTVAAVAAPFFTNQGYELVDEPARTPETPGRHEASEPAGPADPGASTTTPTTPEEN